MTFGRFAAGRADAMPKAAEVMNASNTRNAKRLREGFFECDILMIVTRIAAFQKSSIPYLDVFKFSATDLPVAHKSPRVIISMY